MSILFTMLSLQFMQRAFLVGLVIGPLLASLGIIAALRRLAFFGDGIAHASLAGIALAVLFGWAPLPVALIWGALVGAGIFFLQKNSKLSADTVIGILFTSCFSIGVIIMSSLPGYQPELLNYLFGNILTIRSADVAVILPLAAVIFAWLFLYERRLVLASLSEDLARVNRLPVDRDTLLYYVVLAMSVVMGVKLLGIVLVSALLIIPPAIGRTIGKSYAQYRWLSVLVAVLMIIVGLTLSYAADWPSGASIVLTGTMLFFLATLFNRG